MKAFNYWRIQMLAINCTKYCLREVLQLKEVERPVPEDNEVLVKVFAPMVNHSVITIKKPRYDQV